MEILAIGGTGNISSDVVALLVERGHGVTVLNRGNSPTPVGCAQLTADRRDKESLATALKDWAGDAVIDFLCFTTRDCELAHGTLKGKTAQYVFISSATVYQKPHRVLPITEDMALGNPFSQYAREKIACERYLRGVDGPDFPVTIVRPSHTFGKTWIPSPISGMDYTVAARILAGKPIIVHDNGQSLWTLTASADLAVGIAGLLGNKSAFGEDFHITSDQALTWNGICHEIGLALGKEPQIVHIPSKFLVEHFPPAEAKLLGDKAEHGVFDNTKIKRFVPEFECRKSLRAAIRESVAWHNEDDSRKKINVEQDSLIDELIENWQRQTLSAIQVSESCETRNLS